MTAERAAMRAVIYARFSSELQRDASIDDQIRVCRALADREGWEIVRVYADAAQSGGSTNLRPQYLALLEDARNRSFDVVIAEALDRLSRDQEDIAALHKRLKFAGVNLVTKSEGVVGELHIGFKGTLNALFLKDLAAKTHRGLEGRIRAGSSAGGLSYGYEAVIQHDARGEPIRGGRRIHPEQAGVVRRIFEMFAAGQSPRAIARQLNAEAIAGPRGREWQDTTLRGHAARGTGILRNRLYIGELVWDRMQFQKNPDSGRRVSRPNDPSKVIVRQVPELRILEQPLWDRVHARLEQIGESAPAQAIRQSRFWERRRPKHLLSGLIFCGACGASISATGKDYLCCPAARRKGSCSSTGSIKRTDVETIVLDSLKEHLMAPEAVKAFTEAFVREFNKASAEDEAGRSGKERLLKQTEAQLDKLIEAVCNGVSSDGLQAKLNELEGRKARLSLELAAPPVRTPRLHPNLSEVYRDKIANLREALSEEAARPEASQILRELIERIALHPVKPSADAVRRRGRTPSLFEIELTGAIASMVALASDGALTRKSLTTGGPVHEAFSSSVKVVAGRGFEPLTFRL